jgi:hypothetical protein
MPSMPSTARRISDSSLAQSMVGTRKRDQPFAVGRSGVGAFAGASEWQAPQLSAGADLGLVSGAVSELDSVVLTCGFLLLVAVIENPVAGVESTWTAEGLRMRIGNLAEQTGTR